MKICVPTTIYTHTGGLIRLYIVIWSVLSQFKWLLLFLHHAWRGHGARLSIRTKDLNNHSDTETGTLSSRDACQSIRLQVPRVINFYCAVYQRYTDLSYNDSVMGGTPAWSTGWGDFVVQLVEVSSGRSWCLSGLDCHGCQSCVFLRVGRLVTGQYSWDGKVVGKIRLVCARSSDTDMTGCSTVLQSGGAACQ